MVLRTEWFGTGLHFFLARGLEGLLWARVWCDLEKKRFLVLFYLSTVVAATIAIGLFFEHYFVVFVFGVWLSVEFFLWRFPFRRRSSGYRVRYLGFCKGLGSLSEIDESTYNQMRERIERHWMDSSLNEEERRWLQRLRSLLDLRALHEGWGIGPNRQLWRGFLYGKSPSKWPEEIPPFDNPSIRDAALGVSDLYWKLVECASGDYPELTLVARRMYRDIFLVRFQAERAPRFIGSLTDAMQSNGGIPFFVLNLVRLQQFGWARKITEYLLREAENSEVDEELRSSLYWVAELTWYEHNSESVLRDFESVVRYLYHLCFSNPDRGGFLEIDSRFFAQFEVINELAKEAFLFRDILVGRILNLWADNVGLFDGVFKSVLECMTQQRNKIYEQFEDWGIYWKREKENFTKDYLYVVEGNLCYANGHYGDAKLYYEKALKRNSELKVARYNLLFSYAKLGDRAEHRDLAELILREISKKPSVYSIVGNSYLILGDEKKAQYYYGLLSKVPGWERKANHYVSTFCYENAMYDRALHYAKRAHAENPRDISIRYHLSQCHSSVGEKDQALEVVKAIGEGPEWVRFYRFTLERDAGAHQQASQTLMELSSDYFKDPEELDAALAFARTQRDIGLLRHLKRSGENGE